MYRKITALEPFFKKAAGLQPTTLLKRDFNTDALL